MDAVYPASASALARGRRLRRAEPRSRYRTTPVTFAEIKEVDEESSETEVQCEERKQRPDVLEERLGRQFAEFRSRRARRDLLRERELESAPPVPAFPPAPHAPLARACSEPATLHCDLLRERELESPPPAPTSPPAPLAPLARAGSEPAALHREAADT